MSFSSVSNVVPLFFDPELLDARTRRLANVESITVRLLPTSLLREHTIELYCSLWRSADSTTPLYTSLVSQRSLNPTWDIDSSQDGVLNPEGDLFGVLKSFVVRVHLRSEIASKENQQLPFIKYAQPLANLIKLANPDCGPLPPKRRTTAYYGLHDEFVDVEPAVRETEEEDDSPVWRDPVILEQHVDLEQLVPVNEPLPVFHPSPCLQITASTPLALRLQFRVASGVDGDSKLFGLPQNTPLLCPIALRWFAPRQLPPSHAPVLTSDSQSTATAASDSSSTSQPPPASDNLRKQQDATLSTPESSSSSSVSTPESTQIDECTPVGTHLSLSIYRQMQKEKQNQLRQMMTQVGRTYSVLTPDDIILTISQLAEKRTVLRELWLVKQAEARSFEYRVISAYRKRRELLGKQVEAEQRARLATIHSGSADDQMKTRLPVAQIQSSRTFSLVPGEAEAVPLKPCSKSCYLLAAAVPQNESPRYNEQTLTRLKSALHLASDVYDATTLNRIISILSSRNLCLCARRRRIITLRRLATRARHAAEDAREQLTALRSTTLKERAGLLRSAATVLSARTERLVVTRQPTLFAIRTMQLNASTMLALRRRQLIHDLIRVLPITSGPEEDYRAALAAAALAKASTNASARSKAMDMLALNIPRRAWYIRGAHLPSSPAIVTALAMTNEQEETSCALGYVVMLVILLSRYLSIQLRYRLVYRGSRSSICDDLMFSQAFPLFIGPKSTPVDEKKFNLAFDYLNRNVKGLIAARIKSWRSLDLEPGNILQNLQVLLQHEVPVD